mgnify:CR=1 FL=1
MAENSKIEWTTHTFNPEEHGRIVADYPCYCVTPDGKVWTRFERGGKRKRVIGSGWHEKMPMTTKKGHLRVELHSLACGVRPRKFFVHALVLTAFVGPCPDGMEGCHGDGNPKNNAVGNLRWDTPVGNWSDRKRHGRGCEGEKNPGGGKLTEATVRLARDLRSNGVPLKLIAQQIGVSVAMVSKVCRGQAWSQVNG